ncbi:lasso peptide biosynthesis B2 protein [Chitinophaga rhizosphaerae]|uniref:lasso peptide biosynthesis B2 protein n=1 Tax=Chitinophaga rhizosphaerae TaxID=1864947 RepID=UPI0013DF88DD|nr:lasso peptide biosynthesis B2 protein [Chitinophaga rhizosphaerae]
MRAQERLLLQAHAITILTETSLRFTGLRTTQKLLTRFMKNVPPPAPEATIVLLDTYSSIFNRMKTAASRKGRCLSQSLAMRFMLGRKGISTDLRIGICQEHGKMEAHAWLEKDGKPVNDHPSMIEGYMTLPLEKVNVNTRLFA